MKPHFQKLIPPLLFSGAVLTGICGFAKESKPLSQDRLATAEISSKQGSSLQGTAVFQQIGNRVHIKLTVQKGPPGLHGVHIHEKGDCSAWDATSAGAHLNPTNQKHGSPNAAVHHLGDLGNLEITADGTGLLELDSDQLSLILGAPNSVLGKALVIHADKDDLMTDPAGNSGDRIGCGVIQANGSPAVMAWRL